MKLKNGIFYDDSGRPFSRKDLSQIILMLQGQIAMLEHLIKEASSDPKCYFCKDIYCKGGCLESSPAYGT